MADVKSENVYDVFIGRCFERKNAEGERTLEQLKDDILDGNIAYEALFGEVVPHYDYDEEVKDGRNLADAHADALQKVLESLMEVWSPKAVFCILHSTGIKKSKKYTGPFVSIRVIVRNVGKYRCGADLIRAGKVPKIFDQSIYMEEGKRQLLRVWGGSKEGEDRELLYVLKGGAKKLSEVNATDPQLASLLLQDSLAQYVEGETLVEVVREDLSHLLTVEEGFNVVVGANGLVLGDDLKISVGDVRPLCVMAGWFLETDRGYHRWRDEMWLLENIACDEGFGDGLDQLMMEVSAVCAEKHTDESVEAIKEVSTNRPKNMPRKHLGHLRKEAKNRSPEEYAAWLKPLKAARKEEDIKVFEDKLTKIKLSKEFKQFKGRLETQGKLWAESMLRAKNAKESINNISTKRMEWMKSKGCPLPRRFFISDQRLFHKQTFDSYELVNDFIDSTLNKAICGGDAIWITHELKVSTAEIESRKLGKCPLEKDDEIFVMFVNREWPDELMRLQSLGDKKAFAIKLESVLKTHGPAENPHFSVREIALERRRTKFSQNVGYFPYLKPTQRVDDFELFNLFDGFRWVYSEIRGGTSLNEYPPEIKPFIWHIYEVLADKDENLGNYLCEWLSFLLKEPNRKPETALFIRSKKTRAGKNIFFREFSRWVMGWSHYLYIQDIKQLTCGFNTHRECKRLVVVGETEGRAGYENCEIMKTIITDSECLWTSKGVDSRHGHDSSAIVILSNNRNVVKIDPYDTRYCAFDMSCEQVGNKAYFNDLVKCFENHGRVIFNWLTNLKTDIDVTKPPLTKFKKDLTMENLSAPIKFIREILEHKLNHLGIPESGGILDVDEKSELRVKSKELYEIYRRWEIDTQGTNQRYVTKLSTFIDELEKLNIAHKKMKSGRSENPWNTMGFQISYTDVLAGYRELIGDANYTF